MRQYAYLEYTVIFDQPGKVRFVPLSSGLEFKDFNSRQEAFDDIGLGDWHIVGTWVQNTAVPVTMFFFLERSVSEI